MAKARRPARATRAQKQRPARAKVDPRLALLLSLPPKRLLALKAEEDARLAAVTKEIDEVVASLDRDLQEAVWEELPEAFAPVPGGWGRMGYTTVNLRTVSDADLARALTEAHAASLPTAKAKRKPKPAAKKRRIR